MAERTIGSVKQPDRHDAGLQGLRDRGDYDRRHRIDASHPQGTIRTGASGCPRSTCACSVECRAPSRRVSTVHHTGTLSAPAICTRAPRSPLSCRALLSWLSNKSSSSSVSPSAPSRSASPCPLCSRPSALSRSRSGRSRKEANPNASRNFARRHIGEGRAGLGGADGAVDQAVTLEGGFCCNDIGSRCAGAVGEAQAAWPLMRRCRTHRR